MNIQKMLQEAASKLQKKMNEFENETFDFNYKELVKFKISGKCVISDLWISSDLIDKDDPETLQDVIAVAINEAYKDVEQKKEVIQNSLSRSMTKGFF